MRAPQHELPEPRLRLPEWCDQKDLTPVNSEELNHPQESLRRRWWEEVNMAPPVPIYCEGVGASSWGPPVVGLEERQLSRAVRGEEVYLWSPVAEGQEHLRAEIPLH
ncbi:hypothetical protein E2C01_068610 [Portunus trituberculatus]|uniref:Uncharacterized protein n=1 Tax=Portunus trituberculatus TaxID=210409 RepID=A0A5B7HWZ3_PORTR|nr:hypothetical protein [Portunus trituberculatus]